MKFCLLISVVSGCTGGDLLDYNQPPRISYAGEYSSATNYTITVVDFTDEDYLNKIVVKRDSVKVTLLGELLVTPLKYCMKITPDTAVLYASQPILEDSYLFPSGEHTTWMKYKVKRPEIIGNKHRVYIEFDMKNPQNEFLPGLKEGLKCICEVNFRLEPMKGWNEKLWVSDFLGIYSNGKYKFIIDTYGKIYKDLIVNATFRDKVREAYQQYRVAGGEAIMDDQKEPQEIVFPIK